MVQRETQSGSAPWLQLLTVLVLALTLRAVWLERADIEHFDEGVYSSNLFFDQSEGFAYPLRHLYAPPLVPAILEYSTMFLGHTSFAAILPGVLFGAMTVGLAFHVARRWFGTEAGWPTAIIAALSEFHIIYSRAALTDVFLGFFLLLAIYLGTEAVRYRRFGTAVLAGVACGLAWWSKYSGWLPIAIVGTAVVTWIVFHRKHARPGIAVLSLVVFAVVTVAVWSPVWFGLEEHGGYTAVRENHQRYVVGFSGWFQSAQQQFNAHRVLDGWVAWVGLGLAMLFNFVWQLRTRGFTWNQPSEEFELKPALLLKMVLGSLMLMLLAASGVGTTAVLFCIAIGGLAGRLRWPAIPVDSEEASNDEAIARWALPCWIVGVWIGSLTLMTPTYRAYPRLTLPWLIAVWLGAGAGISWWVRSNLRWHGRKGSRRPVLQQNVMLTALCCLAAFVIIRNGVLERRQSAGWKPRSGLRELARDIAETAENPEETVIYTFGEPGLLYHLNSIGITTRPVSSVPTTPAMSGGQVLLIEGPHARRTDGFEEAAATIARHYDKAGSHDVSLSDLVLLNEYDGATMLGTDERRTESFHVWRLRTEPEDD